MKAINTMKMEIESRSVNESFSRVAVASFIAQLDPTIEELGDIKTAVSEAVTNSIVHGYKEGKGKIYITAKPRPALSPPIVVKRGSIACFMFSIPQPLSLIFTLKMSFSYTVALIYIFPTLSA